MSSNAASARSGRRSGTSTAQADILAAARELFAAGGFDKTTLRAVADHAGVDVALISYYFTNKRGLFLAAMELPIDPGTRVAAAAAGPRASLGRRLTETFLEIWDDPVTGTAMQGFLRSAVSDEATATSFGEFASEAMLPLVVAETGLHADTARVLSSMLFGIATMRYLLKMPMFTAPSTRELIALYAPRVQAVIDADDGPG